MATNTPVASNTHTPTTAASTIIQTTRSSGNAATDFPKFPKLPRELRDMIWRLADNEESQTIVVRDSPNSHIPTSNKAYKRLTVTTKESREMCLKNGKSCLIQHLLQKPVNVVPCRDYLVFNHDKDFWGPLNLFLGDGFLPSWDGLKNLVVTVNDAALPAEPFFKVVDYGSLVFWRLGRIVMAFPKTGILVRDDLDEGFWGFYDRFVDDTKETLATIEAIDDFKGMVRREHKCLLERDFNTFYGFC